MPTTTDPLARAATAYRRAETVLERRRRELADAIAEAVLERGMRQADAVCMTGYSREHIRRICREHSDRIASRAANPPPS